MDLMEKLENRNRDLERRINILEEERAMDNLRKIQTRLENLEAYLGKGSNPQ